LKNKKQKGEQFWDRTAKSYDRSESKDFKQNKLIVDAIKKYTNTSDSVLDFACGTGTYAIEMASIAKNVVAIDLSQKMLEIAEEKTQKLSIKNIDFLQASIFDENLKNETFDIVYAFYILHLLEDPQEVLMQIYSLLKPGDLFITVCPCMGESKVLGGLMSFISRLGFLPSVYAYKAKELELYITKLNFKIIESQKLEGSFNQQFLVCKK